jgi:hypothetical protein
MYKMPNSILRKLFSPFKCHTAQQKETPAEVTQQRLTKNISFDTTTSRDTLLRWATTAESLCYTQKKLSTSDTYTIYRTPSIINSKKNKLYTQLQDFHKLLSVAEQNHDNFTIYCIPSRMGITPKTNPNKQILIHESLDQFNQQDLLNLTWFFDKKNPATLKPSSTQARISICGSSKNYKQLIDILSNLMHPDHELNKTILQAKILGPGVRDFSKETAILYLDYEKLNDESLSKLQQILKPLDNKNSKGIPFCMHPLTHCVGYGEQTFESIYNNHSFGNSRVNIIHLAIANRVNNPKMSLAETLKEECSNNGLDPSHPAFCSGNYDKFHIVPI